MDTMTPCTIPQAIGLVFAGSGWDQPGPEWVPEPMACTPPTLAWLASQVHTTPDGPGYPRPYATLQWCGGPDTWVEPMWGGDVEPCTRFEHYWPGLVRGNACSLITPYWPASCLERYSPR